jgi:uncharacterized protein YjbJ (UPF0337 family)
MTSGTRDEAEGKVKEIAGKANDNPKLLVEGKEERRTGKVQEKMGEVKKVIGTWHSL